LYVSQEQLAISRGTLMMMLKHHRTGTFTSQSTLLTRCLLPLTLLLTSAPLFAQADRIHGRVDPARRVSLRGYVHPDVRVQFDRGPVDPGERIRLLRLSLKRTPEQQAALDRLLEEQQDPASSNYHKWLTPEEFGEQFGSSRADLDQIRGWLATSGFMIDYVAPARNWIVFSGPAAQVEAAFGVSLRRFEVGGRIHYANTGEPSIPEAVAPLVQYLGGLHDFPLAQPPKRTVRRSLGPKFTGNNGTHGVFPGDLAVIYNLQPLYQTGITGSGQKIAIIGQTQVRMSDIQAFRQAAGLSSNLPQQTLVPGSADPGITKDDEGEADMDLEWAGGLAPDATIRFVTSTDILTSLEYAIQQNVAPVISISYGECEQKASAGGFPFTAYRSTAQQANAQGITILVSSGDAGAATCDRSLPLAVNGLDVNFLASPPEITSVGGTEFNEGNGRYWNNTNTAAGVSALSYIPETAWNDSAINSTVDAAGGGGSSILFARPSWQTGPGIPNDTARHQPDVALTASWANDPYVIAIEGDFEPNGGTSAAAPSFAAIVALLNQYQSSANPQAHSGQGNINPNLYRLAQTSPDVFHDITVGDNIMPCKVGTKDCTTGRIGYRAGPGYDMATGLGSVDAYKLVTGWNATSVTGTRTSVSANPASIQSTSSTVVTATVAATSGTLSPSGYVTFGAGGASLGTAALSGTGGNSTASLTVNGSQLATGANTVTATYNGGTGFGGSNGSGTVTVTTPSGGPTTTSLSANPSSLSSTANTTLTATVKASGGTTSPTGVVTFLLGNVSLGSGNLSGSGGTATASLTVNGNQLSAGNNTISAVYAGSGGFGGSIGTATVAVTVSATSTSTSLSANPSGIASTGNTVLTATVRAVSGTTSPGGNLTFALGTTPLGSAALSGSGGTATASITVNGSQFAAGANTVTASYTSSGGFGASSGTATVTVSAAVSGTATSVSASPASITIGATTVLTATVRAVSGSAAPSGQVSFNYGSLVLGTANLSSSGNSAVATLTVYGNRLSVGANTITAYYGGSQGFNASSGNVTVTVTIPSSSAAVIPSIVPEPIFQQAADADGYSWFYTVRLSEIGGVATSITAFSIDNTDYTGNIQAWFGSTTLPAKGTLAANLRTRLSNVPVNRNFTFAGTDANGQKWTQQISVAFLPKQIAGSMVLTSSPGTVVHNPNGFSYCDSTHQEFFQQVNLQEQNG
jgi:subtilase family serine protease